MFVPRATCEKNHGKLYKVHLQHKINRPCNTSSARLHFSHFSGQSHVFSLTKQVKITSLLIFSRSVGCWVVLQNLNTGLLDCCMMFSYCCHNTFWCNSLAFIAILLKYSMNIIHTIDRANIKNYSITEKIFKWLIYNIVIHC